MGAVLSPMHEALLAAFLAEETACGRRPRGVESLRYGAKRFLRFLEERGTEVCAVTLADARDYQRALIEGVSAAGTAYKRATVKDQVRKASALCRWLERTGRILDNPFERVRRVMEEAPLPKNILRETDMATLLAQLCVWNERGALKAAIRRYITHVVAELQYASGLRIAEVAALEPADVDLDRALVYVREGKQGLSRTAFLTDYACQVLEEYLRTVRPLLATEGRKRNGHLVFYTGYRWLTEAMNKALAVACREAGVPVITTHGFRHALGYHLLRGGCPLRYIQAILGHRCLASTEVYTKVDVADVKRVFDACHPRMHG